MDQSGERFRYNTGATVAGVLIERVTGAPFGEVNSCPMGREPQRAASKAWPTWVTDGPGLNRPVVPLPAEVGRANQA